MPQVGPITMWVISTTRTPVSGRFGVVMGVSVWCFTVFWRPN
jgi:hypothetical protein